MRLCVFLLLLSHVVSAQIPRGLTSVARIREEIRIPLDNKMIQMRQNFIETPRQGVLIYSADKNIRCPNDNIVFRGEPLLRVVTNEEIHPIKRTIKTYYGCSKNIAYREITVETKSQFRYELLGPDNLSIFSLLRSDRGASAQSEIKLLGNIVYRIQEFSRQQVLYSQWRKAKPNWLVLLDTRLDMLKQDIRRRESTQQNRQNLIAPCLELAEHSWVVSPVMV